MVKAVAPRGGPRAGQATAAVDVAACLVAKRDTADAHGALPWPSASRPATTADADASRPRSGCSAKRRPARLKYYFVHLPATASLRALVTLAHQRWAIEQQYQELKSELGLDHFEGRSYPGWCHHLVLTAVAHAYVERERKRAARGPTLTFPAVRAIVQEIFMALLFAAKSRYIQWMEQARRKLQLRI